MSLLLLEYANEIKKSVLFLHFVSYIRYKTSYNKIREHLLPIIALMINECPIGLFRHLGDLRIKIRDPRIKNTEPSK